MRLLHIVVFPPHWARLLALIAFVVVGANVLWHGAPSYAAGQTPAHWDVLARIAIFGGAGAAAWVMLGGGRRTADLLAPMAALAVGFADKATQSLDPGRVVALSDLAAEALGAILAALILATLRERLGSVGIARAVLGGPRAGQEPGPPSGPDERRAEHGDLERRERP